MTFEEYQKLAKKTAQYPVIGQSFIYPVLGLTGEAGEMANKIKKIFRDDNGVLTEERKKEISKELGDILWYVAQVSTDLGISLDEVAVANIEMLKSRQERNVLKGDGDNR
jgi:NTP pyrophosphatase (non-canonical NTP hydrolase)